MKSRFVLVGVLLIIAVAFVAGWWYQGGLGNEPEVVLVDQTDSLEVSLRDQDEFTNTLKRFGVIDEVNVKNVEIAIYPGRDYRDDPNKGTFLQNDVDGNFVIAVQLGEVEAQKLVVALYVSEFVAEQEKVEEWMERKLEDGFAHIANVNNPSTREVGLSMENVLLVNRREKQ